MAQTEALTVPTLWKVILKVYLSYVEVGKVSPKLLSLVENLKFYQDLLHLHSHIPQKKKNLDDASFTLFT
jgi:hypothetical protein